MTKHRTGFKKHLNSSKSEHRGFGYNVWRIARNGGLNKTALGLLFGVSFNTVVKWIEWDDQELQELRDKHNREVEQLRD